MSKQSTNKKARRQKRIAQRVVWARLMEELDEGEGDEESFDLENEEPDDVEDLVAKATDFDRRITERGWTFDADNSAEGLASWFFAPSGHEPEGDDVESVTRVWFTTPGDFPDSVYVILAGSDGDDDPLSVTLDRFFEKIDAIEAHRAR